MSTPKYVFSAGHNSHQRGACHGDFCEYPETLEWVLLFKKYFNEPDCLFLTDNLLSEKIKIINEIKPTPVFAIEIHFNSSPSGGHGSESLFTPSSEKSKMLAKFVQDELGKISTPNRGIKEGWYKQDYERRIPDAFLAQTKPVAIIVEPFFVQQGKEFVQAQREKCVEAIALGAKKYLELITRA